jgi:hypothetical protein
MGVFDFLLFPVEFFFKLSNLKSFRVRKSSIRVLRFGDLESFRALKLSNLETGSIYLHNDRGVMSEVYIQAEYQLKLSKDEALQCELMRCLKDKIVQKCEDIENMQF